jgi:kinesin family protein 2/24
MPSQRTGARPVTARMAATPDRAASSTRVGREGSNDSIGRPATRRQSVGPPSASKRPVSASSSRRSSAVGGAVVAPPVGAAKDRVTCIVRKRPAKDPEVDVVNVVDSSIVQVAEPRQKVDLTPYTENHQFTFDHAFGEKSRNEEVYNAGAKPLVEFVVEGGMGTCFAFGQTGSGKTFTMLGAPEAGQRGLYLLAADDMFRLCENSDGIGIFVSMMEIYGDEVYDLLSRDKKKLVPREDAKKKVQIAGLTEFAVHSSEELMMAIEEGSQVQRISLSVCRTHTLYPHPYWHRVPAPHKTCLPTCAHERCYNTLVQ